MCILLGSGHILWNKACLTKYVDSRWGCNSGLSWVIPEMYLPPSAFPQQWLLLCQPTQHVADFPMRHISSLVSPVRWEKICLLCCPLIRKWKVSSSLQRNLHQWRMFILNLLVSWNLGLWVCCHLLRDPGPMMFSALNGMKHLIYMFWLPSLNYVVDSVL